MANADHIEPSLDRPVGFLAALQIQDIILGKLILHGIRTRFERSRLGYAQALLDPCVHLLVWWVLMTFIKERQSRFGMAPILVITTGLVPMFLFRNTSKYMASSNAAMKRLIRHPQVRPLDVVFARFILEALTMITVGLIIFITMILLGQAPLPRDPLALFPPLATLLFMGLGFGTFFAVAAPISSFFPACFTIFMRFIYFTSGIFVLGNHVPLFVMRWFLWNPVFHCVEIFRAAYFDFPIERFSAFD